MNAQHGWFSIPSLIAALVAVMLIVPAVGFAQEIDISDEVWKPMMEEDGVAFSYIFYRHADNVHNGVVIRLFNSNAFPIRYEFTVVFRSGEDEFTDSVYGMIGAGELKTGDHSGLFWIPFKDERQIDQVGLRGWRITEYKGTSSDG